MSKENQPLEQQSDSGKVLELLKTPIVDKNRLAVMASFKDLPGVSALYTSTSTFRTMIIAGTEQAVKIASNYHFPNETSEAHYHEFEKVDDFIKIAKEAFKLREAEETDSKMEETKKLLSPLDYLQDYLYPLFPRL